MARPPLPALVAAATAAALVAAACSGGPAGSSGGDGTRLPAAEASSTGSASARADATGDADEADQADQADDGTDTADLPASLTGQTLDWSPCPPPRPEQGDDESTPPPLTEDVPWECADMTAPLDYAEPEGDTIEIALIRARTEAEGERRLGSLVFNFGGPGGSGVATLPVFAEEYGRLHERYDLVSFDPRGVGASEGLVCYDDERLDAYFAALAVPRTAEQRQRFTDRLGSFAAACEDRAGPLLPHLTTANTARDLDLMREVLGDDVLHYFGVSYGTQLGGVYAHLFPERVGRAVLDAVVDPTLTPEQSARGQAEGFQHALETYLEHCAGEDDCPLGDDADEATDRLGELLARLRAEPLRTEDPDGRRLTESLAWNGIAQSLYSQDFWSYLTQGLDDALAEEGADGTVLLALGDAMNGRNPDGTYTTLQASLTAISCADARQRYTERDVRRLLDDFSDSSPVFGPPLAWGLLGCSQWPVRGSSRDTDVGAEGAAPILLIGTTGDPATPYEGTRRMKEALGDDVAVELTYDGEGHGAYTSGNACVRDTADAYLLEGRVPEDGSSCG
ncbi:alpha/beta hydrolase [Streptomyces sp. B6B3]|uniref:alpha/beta hydrolase n=1 Tax=Streptomyces sp. B6B3 TaxID=3153570 RepID=UPI00325E7722